MTDQDLNQLIRRSQKSDTDAFGQIIRHFERPIRSWAAAHCPPGADADEVAQKTFLAAFQRLADFEPGTNFPAWLFTIARYQLMTEATRLRRIADYHSRFAPELVDRELERRAEKVVPDQVADRLAALRLCLAEIGERGRELLAWRYDDQISLNEVSERTGRKVGAIKKQLFTLRQKLLTCVEEKLEGGLA